MKQIEKVKKLYKPKFEIVRAEKVKDNYILFLVSYYDVRKDETND